MTRVAPLLGLFGLGLIVGGLVVGGVLVALAGLTFDRIFGGD
jgi:hypothetical protein